MSGIEEYYLGTEKPKRAEVSNEDLERLMLQIRREQIYMLDQIRYQGRPQLGQQFLVNLSANAIWDGILFLGAKLIK